MNDQRLPHVSSAQQIDTPLSAVLRGHRQRLHVSQRELAARVGCSIAYIWKQEAGACAPARSDVIDRIATALGLSAEEREELIEAARMSKTTVSVPRTTNACGFVTLHKLATSLPRLSSETLIAIQEVIAKSTEKENLCP